MNKKTIACIIARCVSTRLPLKVLRNIVDKYSMLDFIIQRVKQVKNIDDIYICTSYEMIDDILEDVAFKNRVKIYRGAPDAVIERLIAVGELEKAENVIRITGDNVLTAYEYLDEQIEIHNINELDYTRIIDVPVGATAEIMTLNALKKCYNSIDPSVSEYLLLYMFNPEYYKCGVINVGEIKKSSNYTLTVDTKEDLERTRSIFEYYKEDPLKIKLKDVINIVDKYNLKNSKIEFSQNIKMPYGKKITFEEFQNDMQNRINNSIHFTIGK